MKAVKKHGLLLIHKISLTLKKNKIMETNNEYNLVPGFGNSFGTGWRVMTDNFFRLFLVIVILAILVAPFKIFNLHFGPSDFHGLLGTGTGMIPEAWNHIFGLASLGNFRSIFYSACNALCISCRSGV